MAIAMRTLAPPRTVKVDDGWYGLCAERPVEGRPARLPARTYYRRRVVAAGLLVAMVLAVWVALGTLGGGPLPVPERPGLASAAEGIGGPVYVVQPGDTFWTIAVKLRPSGDPRPLVDQLVATHGGTTLHVGERIPLPAR